jgi:hypothetical protein
MYWQHDWYLTILWINRTTVWAGDYSRKGLYPPSGSSDKEGINSIPLWIQSPSGMKTCQPNMPLGIESIPTEHGSNMSGVNWVEYSSCANIASNPCSVSSQCLPALLRVRGIVLVRMNFFHGIAHRIGIWQLINRFNSMCPFLSYIWSIIYSFVLVWCFSISKSNRISVPFTNEVLLTANPFDMTSLSTSKLNPIETIMI